jgi:Tfp pilus assembly protein PilF
VGVAEANYNLGYILNEQGKISEAENYLMKALKLKPDLKQAEATLADIRAAKADAIQPASFNKNDRF